MLKIIKNIALALIFSVCLHGLANAETAKLQQLQEDGGNAKVLKSLDADKKKLEKSYQELLIKEGYIQPNATNCHTECTVSCTWVDGKCQPTTSCSLKCDF